MNYTAWRGISWHAMGMACGKIGWYGAVLDEDPLQRGVGFIAETRRLDRSESVLFGSVCGNRVLNLSQGGC